MSRYWLVDRAQQLLLDALHYYTRHDCENLADLLAHIAEVARRRLYAEFGYPSMKAHCVQVLRFSEDAAKKRIQVARKAWVLPVIFEAIADGRVHLSGMNLLVPFMDEENVDQLIAAATGRTCAEIELLLAERYPEPEPEESVDEVQRGAAPHLRNRSEVKPYARGRYVGQYSVNEAQHERLQYALQLMSHRNPKGNLSVLNLTGLELLIEELEKEVFGKSDRPREGAVSASGRHIPRAVARQVWERDGGRCTFVSKCGRRCESRWMLQFDHIVPFAQGGESTVGNVRLLCHGHNQYAADCAYGAEFMERKRRGASEEPGSREDGGGEVAGAARHLAAQGADVPLKIGVGRDASSFSPG